MSKIVLSYRRDDAKTITNWLHEKLVERYGKDAIFRDIDSIELTENFRKRIGRTLKGCEFVIAVIGPAWQGPLPGGQSRIAAANDWIRIEMETALQLDIPLLPVLVEDAEMPDPETLPPSLRELAEKNALRLASGGAQFYESLNRLFAAVDKVIGFSPEPAPPTATEPQPSRPPLSGDRQSGPLPPPPEPPTSHRTESAPQPVPLRAEVPTPQPRREPHPAPGPELQPPAAIGGGARFRSPAAGIYVLAPRRSRRHFGTSQVRWASGSPYR